VCTSPASASAAAGNVVATAKHSTIALYRSPHSRRPYTHLRNTLNPGGPFVFLVKSRAAGWEKVYLPVRPNGTTAWVRDGDVTLASNPYVVDLSLTKHHIEVFKGQTLVDSEPAGVGRSVLPTPRGTYYLVTLLRQSNPRGAYGPYAFGLSAYSNVLQSFGGGPGEIGLHGTDYPQGLGTNVSHGCIRISNVGITRLAHLLPLGTPVIIH
jgi:lipoprotein-anchoring transpeptidase ErfK/SrfK